MEATINNNSRIEKIIADITEKKEKFNNLPAVKVYYETVEPWGSKIRKVADLSFKIYKGISRAINPEPFTAAVKHANPIEALKNIDFSSGTKLFKGVTAVTGVFCLIDIGLDIYEFTKTKEISDQIEIILRMLSNVGYMIDCGLDLAHSLDYLAILDNVSSWATPVTVAAVGLQALGIGIKVKGLIQDSFFKHEMQKVVDSKKNVQEKFSALIEKLKGDEWKKKVKLFKSKDLMEHVNKIDEEAKKVVESPTYVQERDGLQNRFIKSLKDRMTTMQISKTWGIVAATASVIAIGVLIFCPPFALATYSVLLVTTLVGISLLIYSAVKDKQFANELKTIASAMEDLASRSEQPPEMPKRAPLVVENVVHAGSVEDPVNTNQKPITFQEEMALKLKKRNEAKISEAA